LNDGSLLCGLCPSQAVKISGYRTSPERREGLSKDHKWSLLGMIVDIVHGMGKIIRWDTGSLAHG